MKLTILLIRHAESIDNVKGIYAGTRDAPLTSHGHLQATRLATHLSHTTTLSHTGLLRTIYTSPLTRAAKTAAILAQPFFSPPLTVTPLLSERDYGPLEGASYRAKQQLKVSEVAESLEHMAMRSIEFVEIGLGRLVEGYRQVIRDRGEPDEEKVAVAVVSHGVILREIAKSIDEKWGNGRWSEALRKGGNLNNTGYVHFELEIDVGVDDDNNEDGGIDVSMDRGDDAEMDGNKRDDGKRLVLISANCEEHLKGLVKTKGGIGSAAHDSKQQTLDSFFRHR